MFFKLSIDFRRTNVQLSISPPASFPVGPKWIRMNLPYHWGKIYFLKLVCNTAIIKRHGLFLLAHLRNVKSYHYGLSLHYQKIPVQDWSAQFDLPGRPIKVRANNSMFFLEMISNIQIIHQHQRFINLLSYRRPLLEHQLVQSTQWLSLYFQFYRHQTLRCI